MGEVHALRVKQDAIEAVASFSVRMPQAQLVRSVIYLNYGEETELPKLTADIKKPKDQQANAERDLTLFGKLGLPVTEKFLYQRHNVPQPKPGDELFVPKASNIKVPELAGLSNQL